MEKDKEKAEEKVREKAEGKESGEEKKRKEEELKKKAEEKRKEFAKEEKEKEREKEVAKTVSFIRILSADVPGEKSVLFGLARIKGVSFAFSNALCQVLGIEKERKMSSLTNEEIEKITSFIMKPSLPSFMFNRRRDLESGEDKHLVSSALELQRDFDIRRLKKIRSYRGWRHALGQPVRGQRTRSHFRHGAALGVVKEKARKEEAAERGKKAEKKEGKK